MDQGNGRHFSDRERAQSELDVLEAIATSRALTRQLEALLEKVREEEAGG